MSKQAQKGNEITSVPPGGSIRLQRQIEKDQTMRRFNFMANASELTNRSFYADRLGKSFQGKRDLYQVLGYEKLPTFRDYHGFYARDGLATVVVDKVADETWREPPFLLDQGQEANDARESPSALQTAFSDLADSVDLYASFSDLDAALGYSRFAVLFLGLPGKLDQPVTSAEELTYVQVYDEGQVILSLADLERDVSSARFGLPTYYQIQMDENNIKNSARVHYTRVIHVKEGRGRSRIYGVPRLQKILNRLYDLEKVVGSSSEAFWLMVYRGIAFQKQDGYEFPADGTDGDKALSDEIEEYVQGLKRYLKLNGVEAKDLGGTAISGKEQFDMIVAYIAGATSIPQRILLGSERGNLASGQDDLNFADYIKSRQTHFAEPRVLRVFIQRMKELGVLKVPDKYKVNWPSLFTLNPVEKSDIALKVAQALSYAGGGAPETVMPGHIYAERYLDYTQSEEDFVDPITGDLVKEAKPDTPTPPDNGVDPVTGLPIQATPTPLADPNVDPATGKPLPTANPPAPSSKAK